MLVIFPMDQVSYMEIYNEKVRDLLNPSSQGNLKVRKPLCTSMTLAFFDIDVSLSFSLSLSLSLFLQS